MDAAGGGAAAKTPVTVGEQEASGGCLCQAAPLAGRLAWPATGPRPADPAGVLLAPLQVMATVSMEYSFTNE